MKKVFLIVAVAGLALVAQASFGQSSLLMDRGLPSTNLSTPMIIGDGTPQNPQYPGYWGSTISMADYSPIDPQWTWHNPPNVSAQDAWGPPTFEGSTFVMPSGARAYYVTDIRVWMMDQYNGETTSGQIADDVPAFESEFSSISLMLGPGSNGPLINVGTTPTITQAHYGNGSDFGCPNGPDYCPIIQLDYPVNQALTGGATYAFGVLAYGTPTPNASQATPANLKASYYLPFMSDTEVGYSSGYPNDSSTGTESEFNVSDGTLAYTWQIAPVWSGVPNGDYNVQVLGTALHPGDANGDNRVDINDLTIVLANYNQTGMTWAQGDFNGDGRVDINDLTVVLANYGGSYGAASRPAAVPEPSALALLAAGLVGLFAVAWRKRRAFVGN
jgi:hypothetical protein